MNTTFRRCLHLSALLALGALVFTGNRAFAVSGTPVSACTTLAANTNYYLSTNINATGTCFIVGANTSLDLNKHTIKGNNTGDGITDDGGSSNDVVIVNGTITRFSNGINLASDASYNLSVDNVTTLLNTNDGIASAACCNMITNVKSNNNGDDGIDFYDDSCCNTFSNVNTSSNAESGLYSEDCCSLAFGVTSNGNEDDDGIELLGCCNAVEGSTANGNGDTGIDLTDGSYENSVESSTANNNGGDGIFFGDECCSQVDHATANGNSGDGIVAGSDDNLVSNSTASKNQGDGIDLTGEGFSMLMRNVTTSNGFIGTVVICASDVVRLTSTGNGVSDLCEIDSTCTNLINFTEKTGCP